MYLNISETGFDSGITPPDGLIVANIRLKRAVHKAAGRVKVVLRADAQGEPYVDPHTPRETRAKLWNDVQEIVLVDSGMDIARARKETSDLRGDALNTSAGLIGREMLVSVQAEIDEPLPVFEFPEVAEVNSTLPLGAESFRIRYKRLSGEASVMRSGQTAPLVDASIDSTDRPQSILWSRSMVTFLDNAQGAFAGVDVSRIRQEANEPAHLSVVDSLFWNGSDTLNHWGVFNYPAIPEFSTGLSLAALTGAQLETAILNSVNRVRLASNRRFSPKVIRVAQTVYGYMESLKVGSTGTVSVLQSLQANGYTVTVSYHLDAWNGVSGSYAVMVDGLDGTPGRMQCFFRRPILVPGNVSEIMSEMFAISGFGGAFLPHPVAMEATLFTA